VSQVRARGARRASRIGNDCAILNGFVRGFEHERFIAEGGWSEGWRSEPEGGEAAGVAREGGACEEWREACAGGVGFGVQGEGLVREHEEDDVPAEGCLGSGFRRGVVVGGGAIDTDVGGLAGDLDPASGCALPDVGVAAGEGFAGHGAVGHDEVLVAHFDRDVIEDGELLGDAVDARVFELIFAHGLEDLVAGQDIVSGAVDDHAGGPEFCQGSEIHGDDGAADGVIVCGDLLLDSGDVGGLSNGGQGQRKQEGEHEVLLHDGSPKEFVNEFVCSLSCTLLFRMRCRGSLQY
jgi:hypothetical protein